MMSSTRRTALFAPLFFCGAARSEPAAKKGRDLAAEAMEISKSLRRLDSPNESIYEATDAASSEIKARIYELLAAGKSRGEVMEYFAARYGEKIRYEPAATASTAALWAAPAALAALAALGAARLVLKRRKQIDSSEKDKSK